MTFLRNVFPWAAAALLSLGGCTSTRMLKTPVAGDAPSMGVAQDADIELRLTGVIYRDGPGSWTRKAYWDEYRVAITNHTNSDVRIESLTLADPLQVAIAGSNDRRALARATRDNLKRYRDSGLSVKPGASPTGLVAAGGALTLGGATVAGSAAATGVMGVSGSGTMLAAGAGVAVGGIALLGVGIDRMIQNGRIQQRIEERSLTTIALAADHTAEGGVFFPLVPAPQRMVLRYRDAAGTAHELSLDLTPQLSGLHLAATP